jgi:hypothetical protein
LHKQLAAKSRARENRPATPNRGYGLTEEEIKIVEGGNKDVIVDFALILAKFLLTL